MTAAATVSKLTAFAAIFFPVAVATFTVATAVTAVATALVSAAQLIDEALDFLLSSLTSFQYLTSKVQSLACQRMVQVHFYVIVCYFQYFTIESVAVFILQRHNCIFIDVLTVEVAVHMKHLFVQVDDMSQFVITVSLLLVELEVEFCIFLQFQQFSLECI